MIEGRRIAHLIESDGPGGAERVVAHLASSLQAAGADNVVFVPAAGEGWLARELDGTGVAIEPFRLDRPLSPGCAAHLASVLRHRRIDLAHSHEFSMAVYGAWAARLARVPHVITMHGGRYYAERLRRRIALRTAIQSSAMTVAVSEQLARALSRDLWLHPSRIATVPNGVPRIRAGQPALRTELGLAAGDQLLVSIGNLYPVKGHVHLIDAVARLANRYPRLHAAIGGRGDLERPLNERARSHRIGDRIHLLGLRSDVGAVLSSADVFVLPSLSEGLPLALLEAMFTGCPIVASDVGEIGVALAHGEAGVLVPPGDPAALAEALDAVLANPDRAKALGARAETRAAAEYDIARMVGRYVAAYARQVVSQ
jgi:glycosyltransferase involved in cell wall biosynthesis